MPTKKYSYFIIPAFFLYSSLGLSAAQIVQSGSIEQPAPPKDYFSSCNLEEIRRPIDVKVPLCLWVKNRLGETFIEGIDSEQGIIEINATDERRAKVFFKRCMSSYGETIKIRVNGFDDSDRAETQDHLKVDLKIKIPQSKLGTVEVESAGSISIRNFPHNLLRCLTATSDNGDISLMNIETSEKILVTARGFGNIGLKDLIAAKLLNAMAEGSGNIVATTCYSDEIFLIAIDGRIVSTHSRGGKIVAENTNGDIYISQHTNGSVCALNTNGNNYLDNPESEDEVCHSRYGKHELTRRENAGFYFPMAIATAIIMLLELC